MYCSNCGRELPEEAKFCVNCGARIGISVPEERKTQRKPRKPTVERKAAREERISDNITLCEDGKYRWVYEMSLFKNPTVFFLVWRILFFVLVGMFVFLTLVESGGINFWWDGFLTNAVVFGYIMIGMTAVSILGYLLYAAVMGGKYIVEFEMDEKGINHKQIASQARKAQKLGKVTSVAGAATGRFSVIGAGMSAQRTSMYSDFSSTKKVRAYPRRNLIKVNGTLSHNQVYAAKEDFEFVKDFILSHCDNLK